MLAAATAAASMPVWSQTAKPVASSRGISLAQIADMSAAQVDISKDFVVGSRAAWQDINAKGGVRGRPVQIQTIEVDGGAANLRAAVDGLRQQPNLTALFGTSGDFAANQVSGLLRRDAPDLPHIAPWIHNTRIPTGDATFPIFASRQEQIAHAVKSLSAMGISEIGAVYATPAEFANYKDEMEQTAGMLKLRLRSYGPAPDLQRLSATLTAESPRVLVFLGGTPELLLFTQGIDKQAVQRYIVAMSDVNLQTFTQLGFTRHAPVIATQVVPLVNSNSPLVRSYREVLTRLFDEPPTPHSLAGFIAARYTYECLMQIEGLVTRAAVLQTMQRRSAVDLGGFKIDPDTTRRSGTYVTQSMMTADGRIVG
jgi:ABC-type branched-subunit amino acid transport system substrate-binding protein